MPKQNISPLTRFFPHNECYEIFDGKIFARKLDPSPFCFSFWSFLLLFSAEHMVQRGISACRICLFRVDLLPLMLANTCQLCFCFLARAISARFLLFCAVSARCVLHLCSTVLVVVVCGLAQRSQLHCFMCLVFRCRLVYFCAREILILQQ